MKKFYLPGLLCLFFFQINAQTPLPEIIVKRCATYEVLENFRKANPQAETDAQFEDWLSQRIQQRQGLRTQATVVLPVIFHIINNGEAVGNVNNASAAAIRQQMLQINKDFANLSNSPYGVAADMEIEFALAQNDSLGNPLAEPGIDRVNRTTAGFTAPPYTVGFASAGNNYLNSTIKPATIWRPAEYLNIWILPMEANVLGIATFPLSSGLPGLGGGETNLTAGVAISPISVGSLYAPNGCVSYGKGKTLSHELGHFFGLRHIWGDGACATDYCNDTPTHFDANSGVPMHPKPNACGTPDEMFENYMDYSDDITLNTFTVDQKTRMQAVLANSPRRATLVTSPVARLAVAGGNGIAFQDCAGALTVGETGTTGTYPRYNDITLRLVIEDEATASGTITVNAGGSAINNFHYQVLTPSLSYVAGDHSKDITVRIFDNAQVEGSRTIALSYSITGSGVIAGATAQTFTITVTDDDNFALNENVQTVYTQDFEGSLSGINTLAYTGSLNTWRVNTFGDAGGAGKAALVSNSATTNTYNATSTAKTILRLPLFNANGFSDLKMQYKYKVWGERDIDGIYDFGSVVYAPASSGTSFNDINSVDAGPFAGETDTISGNPTLVLPNNIFANKSFYIGFNWENDNNTGNNPAFNIDDIIITAQPTQVETAVSSAYGTDILAGNTNFLRSTNLKLLAKVAASSTNISGLTAALAQSGTGIIPVSTGSGSYSRTAKVVTLTPASPNTSTTYQGTIYFTVAELSAWGVQIPTLKILKVKDGVSLAAPISASNGEIITPVFEDHNAEGYYSYTGNFTGFSQFMLVSSNATLPVDLLRFEAKAVKQEVRVEWSTAQETNNKGFGVERSLDGVSFTNIGWVSGQGNSSTQVDYAFTDKQVEPGQLYYFRLRQTDIDGRERLSVVRQVRTPDSGLILSLSPNPAKGQVSLFIYGSKGVADINLLNSQGQRMRNWQQVNPAARPVKLDLGGLTKGIYILQIRVDGEIHVEKLVIE